ncbi:XRE family transcriptional regulator [Yoonia sp.]|uniref:helix-turn-helix domain-containing protein n=1 Tax=Yoonia sp. TaxID=2212373 RepID=UPI0025CF3292|nr:XRE family transcriptional regulator [Yoonia sp.]
MPDSIRIVPSLGVDIRSLRKSRKMTLVQLAGALGRSVGWLSQVERNKSQPSINDLGRIATVLDVSLTSFLRPIAQDGEEGTVVRAGKRRPIGSRTDGMFEELLSPDLTDDFEVLISTFAPHSRLTEPLTRPTQEVCYLTKGRFHISVDGDKFVLAAGDSFRLRGQQFQWANPYDEPCEIIWVISPPVY